MKPVTVILPTLNEKENIIPLLAAINREFSPFEIIVVDDNSPDGTAGEVAKHKKQLPNVKVIRNITRLGLTASIQKGIDCSRTEFVAWMDADFSHPPQILNDLYRQTKQSDIIIASWLIKGGSDQRKEKLVVLRSYCINKLCQLLFGSRVTAYTSGFAIVRRSLFDHFRFRGDYGEYFIDFAVRNLRLGRKIIEVPYTSVSRTAGVTKTSPDMITFARNGIKYISMILSLAIVRGNRSVSPGKALKPPRGWQAGAERKP